MNRFKKVLSMLLAVSVLLAFAAGCTNDSVDPTDNTTATNGAQTGKTGTYNVVIKSAGGLALEGINVNVYADNTKADLKEYGETDAEGKASFEMPVSGDYVIDLQSVPDGYAVEEYYTFSGNTAQITLKSSLITDESLANVTLGLGDVMYDFSVTTTDGETMALSEVLKEKKMALLNFWYTKCGPCANEFPYMDEAYQTYKDKAEVFALDPLEDAAAVTGYKNSMGLTLPMAACPASWSQTFSITGYPTSIVVDRYGVICLIEVGGITSLSPFVSIFEYFTADDYEQKICENGVSDIMTKIKPDKTMDTSENVAAILNQGEVEVTYRPEADDEYCWPFVAGEKNGETCLMATNSQMDDSYAIIYADVTLKAGQAVGFDYLVSSEQGNDVMHVIVNDEAIFSISGADEKEEWKSCYPCVADVDGVYEVALCYIKDESNHAGDDTVYIKNLRIVDPADIDTATYLPRQAAVSEDGFEFDYVDVVLNEEDGYYHVGSADGPLLLADLMGYTQFSEEKTVWDIAYGGDVTIDGHNYYEDLEKFFSYASNSSLNGVCTVTEKLADLLKKVTQVAGFDENDENEWLKICKYYEAYGKDAAQLEDPIKGLAPFSAYKATLGKNVSSNFFYYNRAIIPRGLLAEFVPTQSGVYRITSRNESKDGVDGWIFSASMEELLVYEMNERTYNDDDNVSMLYYMEAGTPYYIDIAFWDMYEVGYIYYDVEFVASSMEVFRLASPGYFTYDTDATGEAMYHTIAGGIDVVLGTDGFYYEDKGKDADGNQIYGSMLYADFTGITSLFSNPISTYESKDADGNPVQVKGMIEMGGFDFSKTEEDLYILSIMEKYNNDQETVDKYLRDTWAEDYEANVEIYKLEDVYAGKYHGEGEDLTEEIKTYLSKMYSGGETERVGCVPVDQRLAELLQLLMDKYTFENVDHSWTKLCYYYDYLGPNG